ncbi:hypothetical protein GOV13_02790 [Candidatus Pacearchaeota archaeon]|nr:hypothetical protein [Candidatus Pacearchaeota archaeon]
MIKTIQSLFINRSDTYGEQSPKGTYSRIEKPLTEKDIQEHIDGKKTIGVYQINTDNIVKWICFDFDGEDLKRQEQLAKNLCMKLRYSHKVESLLMEFSGKKGNHVWVFIEPTDATSAKLWAEEVSEDYNVHEVFPKQEKIGKGKFGNLVKLPLGVHQVSGKRSLIYNEQYEQIPFEQSGTFLKELADKPKIKVPKIIIREIIRTVVKPQGKTDMPSYIKHLVENGCSEGDRHKNSFIIIKELYNAGFKKEEIIENIKMFNNNCSPPKPDYIAENHANYLLQFPERYLVKETTEEIPNDKLAAISNVDYTKVIEVYKKWIYMKDTNAIDLCLATAITRKTNLNPLWLILIAPSGSGKSEILKPIEDHSKPGTTEVMSKITPNTFLSGISKKKEEHTDFAETLENNPKLFLTYDFAQFVKMDSKDKAQVWAQMRDLYDGFIERKAGLGVSKKVTDIRINWLICTTPVIDSELLVHQELGTRELLFRFEAEEIDKQKLMDRVWDNSNDIGKMRKELSYFVRAFIDKKESDGIEEPEISKEVKKELMNIAKMISVLRAATESDSYSGELTNFVYQEMPTRILLQIKSIYIGLKNLDDGYSDKKALDVIKRVALSSIHPIRLRILIELMASHELSTTELQKRLSIGYKTIITQLYSAKQLNLVVFRESDSGSDFEGHNRAWSKKVWKVKQDNEVIVYLKDVKGLRELWKGLFDTVSQ